MKDNITKHIIWVVAITIIMWHLIDTIHTVISQRTLFQYAEGECEMTNNLINCERPGLERLK